MGGIANSAGRASVAGDRMTPDLFSQTPLQEAFHALRSDLIQEDGQLIITMRNYRFAIVQYDPK